MTEDGIEVTMTDGWRSRMRLRQESRVLSKRIDVAIKSS